MEAIVGRLLAGGRFVASGFALLLVIAAPASAVPVTLNLTATGFGPSSGNAAPTDPVTATIVYEAASTTSPITSLTSISLTLNGHVYTLGEVGFVSPFGADHTLIGATTNGLDSVSNLTDDFVVTFNHETATPVIFRYSSATLSGGWPSTTFSQFSITAGAAVPLPGTLLLLACGLLGLGIARRKFG